MLSAPEPEPKCPWQNSHTKSDRACERVVVQHAWGQSSFMFKRKWAKVSFHLRCVHAVQVQLSVCQDRSGCVHWKLFETIPVSPPHTDVQIHIYVQLKNMFSNINSCQQWVWVHVVHFNINVRLHERVCVHSWLHVNVKNLKMWAERTHVWRVPVRKSVHLLVHVRVWNPQHLGCLYCSRSRRRHRHSDISSPCDLFHVAMVIRYTLTFIWSIY